MLFPIAVLASLLAFSTASPDPLITPAPQLARRATDPLLVGYITTSGGYSDVRSCDYTATISTSGSLVQCCPTSGACAFYTACSSNTLLGGPSPVACDVNPTLTCNTAIVLPTPGAANAGSYLACWQKTLGSNPFTFVQDIGSSTAAGGSSRSSGGSSGSSATRTSSSASSGRTSSSTSTSSASSTSSSGNPAVRVAAEVNSGVLGAVALLAQMLL